MNEYWLSIVIPSYNVENFLADCIASIEPSEHNDIEVILVDDGSTDSTPVLCDDFSSLYENVNVIHRENGGAAAARNMGCFHASGKWVWFVDSDDLISPYSFDLLKPICESTDANALHIQFLKFKGTAEPVWPIPSGRIWQITADDYLTGLYSGYHQHYMYSFLLRTENLRKNANGFPFREDFSLYDDVVAVEEMMRGISLIEMCPWTLYGYRQVASSMSHKRNNDASNSGLRAVLNLQEHAVPKDIADDKVCMEIGLLFTAYRIAERGHEGDMLRARIRKEIELRVNRVGVMKLSGRYAIRYLLLETGLMEKIIDWRDFD